MHFYFLCYKQGPKEICVLISDAYGTNSVTLEAICNWFVHFKTGDYSLEDKKHSGRPKELVIDELEFF